MLDPAPPVGSMMTKVQRALAALVAAPEISGQVPLSSALSSTSTRWRGAWLSGLVLLGGATACAPPVAGVVTAAALPDDERRPDGIAVDRSSEPPPPIDVADASAQLVTLRAPLGHDLALEVVASFFRAVVEEDTSVVAAILGSDAQIEDMRAGVGRGPTSAVANVWRERFGKREYQLLTARVLYRPADVETYRVDELERLPVRVREARGNRELEPTDLVLRVPVVTHSLPSERLLGDEMFFWLRRQGERFVIRHMAEPFPF